MELNLLIHSSTLILFLCTAALGSPLLTSSSPSLQLSVNSNNQECEPIEIEPCSHIYRRSQLPNVYGDFSQEVIERKLDSIFNKFISRPNVVTTFFCALYFPPCPDRSSSGASSGASVVTPLPCRRMCEMAADESKRLLKYGDKEWPVRCQTLPTENCYNYDGPHSISLVKTSITATPTKRPEDEVIRFAPLEVELGNEDEYEVEVVSMSSNQIPARRYDITDLGDPKLFHGWVDVQGSGAANDYCRVVGKGKRHFLSCNLAGSTGQGHQYVSKLGFEAGHLDTWFMRDMDGDGRDDYCRCVGPESNSKVSCMKSGDKGFYGSTTQGGSQHTFSLPNSGGCHNKRVNPVFGEKYNS